MAVNKTCEINSSATDRAATELAKLTSVHVKNGTIMNEEFDGNTIFENRDLRRRRLPSGDESLLGPQVDLQNLKNRTSNIERSEPIR